MRTKLFVAFAACTAFLAVSCQEPKAPEVLNPVSAVSYELTSDAQEITLEFETNYSWKVESPVEWISIVTPNGSAASPATVVVSVAENDTWEPREAEIVVSAGESSSFVVKVSQDFTHVFSAQGDGEYEVSDDAGKFVVTFESNDVVDFSCDASWVKVSQTKAAPVKGTYTIAYEANVSVEAREAAVVFTCNGEQKTVTVKQAASNKVMVFDSITWISNSEDTYDAENWLVRTHSEYVLNFLTSTGSLTLAINGSQFGEDGKFISNPLADIPTGEFEADMTGNHDEGTISLSGKRYASKVVVDGQELAIDDIALDIVKEDGEYDIVVFLLASNEKMYSYTCVTNTIPQIVEDTNYALAYVTRCFDYNTHFANKVNQTGLVVYPTRKSTDDIYVRSVNLKLYHEELVDVLPEGSYLWTDEEPTTVESSYANGIYNYLSGKIYYCTAQAFKNADEDYNSVELYYPKAVITKSGDVYSLNLTSEKVIAKEGYYDDDWNWVETSRTDFSGLNSNLVLDVVSVSDNLKPEPDQDFVASTMLSCQTIYFGTPYAELDPSCPGNVYVCSFGYVNGYYTINVPLVDDGSWTFVGNGANASYCKDPFTAGTYTVERGYTPKTFSIAYLKTASYAATIKNSYTGSYYRITKGTVTLDADGLATFDLYGTSNLSGEEVHVTGSLSTFTSYGAKNYTSRASLVTWYPAPATE